MTRHESLPLQEEKCIRIKDEACKSPIYRPLKLSELLDDSNIIIEYRILSLVHIFIGSD